MSCELEGNAGRDGTTSLRESMIMLGQYLIPELSFGLSGGGFERDIPPLHEIGDT